ncbi:uncharacterized protein A1O5_01733 [Cladophialophora psammophila CBS 110553]|uniref:Uncharacterized protein n=1 Tax=Cladophialophora psammophila CBS 110553 TaxID=1182543 RepID=W9X3H8_9EURO|nr:uncharacterized protein A1O5_01733 [Cladophialophora psammophila CBS 110553]EXJ75037.1 hypothetical protein A1O5_01733 [Cladophialophora psammophila CBS 110553]
MDSFSARDLFPDPDLKSWQQAFSARHEKICHTPSTPDPDGEIYGIFNRSNFSRLDIIRGLDRPIDAWLDPKLTISDIFYDRIRPALVLATRFCKYTSEFFNILLFGDIGKDIREDGKIVYDYLQKLKHRSRTFPDLMDDLHNVQFFTGYHPDSRTDVYASTYFGVYPKNCEQQMATTAVQLNSKFTTFFTHLHFDTFEDDVKDLMLVSLAITLVHELAHVWYALRRFEIARKGNLPLCIAMRREPYFYGTERVPELGSSWELFAFNGMPHLNCSDDGPYAHAKGLLLVPVRANSDKADKVVVDSYVVSAFLNQECWDLLDRLLIGDLCIPYKPVIGKGLLERMKTAVVVIFFSIEHGRLPSLEEVAKEKDMMLPYSAKGQQLAKASLPDLAPLTPKLPTDAEITKITNMMKEGLRISPLEFPTTATEEHPNYALQWALCQAKAKSGPTYLADRAANKKRIQKAQRRRDCSRSRCKPPLPETRTGSHLVRHNEITPATTPPAKNDHAPPPMQPRKSYPFVSPKDGLLTPPATPPAAPLTKKGPCTTIHPNEKELSIC